jgi:multisubunit Na+/H+ antiporter MnhE subunit
MSASKVLCSQHLVIAFFFFSFSFSFSFSSWPCCFLVSFLCSLLLLPWIVASFQPAVVPGLIVLNAIIIALVCIAIRRMDGLSKIILVLIPDVDSLVLWCQVDVKV